MIVIYKEQNRCLIPYRVSYVLHVYNTCSAPTCCFSSADLH